MHKWEQTTEKKTFYCCQVTSHCKEALCHTAYTQRDVRYPKCNGVLELRYLVGVWFRLLWNAANNHHIRCTFYLSVFLCLSVLLFFGACLPRFPLPGKVVLFRFACMNSILFFMSQPLVTLSSEKLTWWTTSFFSSFLCLFRIWRQQASQTRGLILRCL